MEYRVAGYKPCPLMGGEQATTLGTPATFGVITVMWADASMGYRPPGMYEPLEPTGMIF